MATTFPGFPREMRTFLRELAEHNERDWFQANKHRYEEAVREPALALITALKTPLKAVSPMLQAIPKKMGGSLLRVYRDTRFSRDKTPYKTNVGLQFRHEAVQGAHAPGYYVHIEPDLFQIYAGIWQPDKISLQLIREKIAEEPYEWQRLGRLKKFREQFRPTGETLQRPPQGFPKDHPLIEELKRKDFMAVATLDPALLESPDVVKAILEHFRTSRPLLQFLCEALELPL